MGKVAKQLELEKVEVYVERVMAMLENGRERAGGQQVEEGLRSALRERRSRRGGTVRKA